MKIKRYGLLGYPLSHSFSKSFFDAKFKRENIQETEYENFELSKIAEVKSLLQQHDIYGFNVTIPYKKLIIPYLDQLDAVAAEIGAVNCVINANGKWIGYNTDIFGFEQSLKPLLNPNRKTALILGTGGASHAISYVLRKLEITSIIVSSHEQDDAISYYDIDEKTMKESGILINTTPLGTFPNIEECPPIPYEWVTPDHLCYDLTYNPEETLFLKKCKEKGASIKNGHEMLVKQAEESWRIWGTGDSGE